MMAADDQGSTGGGGRFGMLTRKVGPLPTWVWMALGLLVALIYAMWQRSRQETVATDDDTSVTEPLPGDQTPPPVFILPQNPQPTVPINITLPPAATPLPYPPGAGRPEPAPAPPPTAKPPPKPTTPTYSAVKVVKYTSKNPPWNSTLWGIAKHYGYGSAGNNYLAIWNDPKNASLKSKRKDPTKIQPGDTVYVRTK